MLDELRERAAAPLGELEKAAELLEPDDDAASGIARGGAAAEAWRQLDRLVAAGGDLARIESATIALAGLVGVQPGPVAVWWLAVGSAAELERVVGVWDRRDGVRRWLELHQLGVPVRLADPAEYRARVDAVRVDRERIASAVEAERQAKRRAAAAPWVEAWKATVGQAQS